MLAHAVKLLARMDPLKYLFEKPALTVAIAFIFSEFEISYVTQKAIKWKVKHRSLSKPPFAFSLRNEFPRWTCLQ